MVKPEYFHMVGAAAIGPIQSGEWLHTCSAAGAFHMASALSRSPYSPQYTPGWNYIVLK